MVSYRNNITSEVGHKLNPFPLFVVKCFHQWFVFGVPSGRRRPPESTTARLGGGSELGHSLGALRHGVLGKLAREHEAHRGLDLAGRKGRLLRVSRQLAGLASKALEDVVDERVHDRHALLRDASVRVHLLEHLVDVRGVRLNALLGALLAGRLLGRLGGFLGRSLGHFEKKFGVVLHGEVTKYALH